MRNDILIAYYSWSGNTRKIAGLIERETGGTLFEIEPVETYTTEAQIGSWLRSIGLLPRK